MVIPSAIDHDSYCNDFQKIYISLVETLVFVSLRKIMALGRSSKVISLPREFLESNDLKRGDYVTVYVQPDLTLVVYPTSETNEKKSFKREISISISTDETKHSIIRKITGCYLNGYDEINLLSQGIFSVEQQIAIRSVVKYLYTRIVESTANKIVLQVFIDKSNTSILSGVKRMYIITSAMCRDILKGMEEKNIQIIKSAMHLEEDVDQFKYHLIRMIKSASVNYDLRVREMDLIDSLDYQVLIHRMERVADHLYIMAQKIITLFDENVFIPIDVFKLLIRSAKISFRSYEDAVESFLSMSVEKTNEIINRQKEIDKIDDTISQLQYNGIKDINVLLYDICIIRDRIKRILECAADIAEITIDHSYKL